MEKLTSVGSGFAVDDVRHACQDFDYDFKVAFFRWLICKKKSCFVNSNSFFFKKYFFMNETTLNTFYYEWMKGKLGNSLFLCVFRTSFKSISYYDAPEM